MNEEISTDEEEPYYYGEEQSMAEHARDFLTSISFGTISEPRTLGITPQKDQQQQPQQISPSPFISSSTTQTTPPPPTIIVVPVSSNNSSTITPLDNSATNTNTTTTPVLPETPMVEQARFFLTSISLGVTPASTPPPSDTTTEEDKHKQPSSLTESLSYEIVNGEENLNNNAQENDDGDNNNNNNNGNPPALHSVLSGSVFETPVTVEPVSSSEVSMQHENDSEDIGEIQEEIIPQVIGQQVPNTPTRHFKHPTASNITTPLSIRQPPQQQQYFLSPKFQHSPTNRYLMNEPTRILSGKEALKHFALPTHNSSSNFPIQRKCKVFFVMPQSSQPLIVSSVKLDRTISLHDHSVSASSSSEPGSPAPSDMTISSTGNNTGTIDSPLFLNQQQQQQTQTQQQQQTTNSSMNSSTTRMPNATNLAAKSYAHLIHPRWLLQNIGFYEPSLDDPILKTGKQGTVLSLSGFRCSIIPYIRPRDLEDELNEQFRIHHRAIHDAGVTLSKLRKNKFRVLSVIKSLNHEVSSAALCFVLMDQLLRSGHVPKHMFKTFSAICGYLSVKFNEMVTPSSLKQLREAFAKSFGITTDEILENEFKVFVDLGFSLFRDPEEVAPYLNAIGHESTK